MSEFTRLAGIEPLYKYDLDPKIDKAKAREAAQIEMARLRKEKEHQSVLDDRTKVMAGLKKPDQAGILDVGESVEKVGGHPFGKHHSAARLWKTRDDAEKVADKISKAVSGKLSASASSYRSGGKRLGYVVQIVKRTAVTPVVIGYVYPKENGSRHENLDMGRQGNPDHEPFAGLESRKHSKSLSAKKAFVKKVQAKYGHAMPGFDPEDYPKIRGMEGPFYMKTKGGRKVLYYDPKEGEYYDRKSDMYFPVDQLESKEVSGILAYSPGKYVLSRENGKYHLEKKSGGRRTHKAVDAKSAYKLYQMAKKKEVAPEDAFPSHVIESIEESTSPGDVWVQHFKTQKSIYFFPLRRGKNGNFQGLMYDPNFSRKAKVSSVPKNNAPKSSRALWKVETRIPLDAKSAFMDHPKYQQAVEALESIEHTASLSESSSKRYEIVVNGKLYKTHAKPAIAMVLARRQKGSVQVIDSEKGDILYDSEVQKKSVRAHKRTSSMQQIRLNRRQSDAELRMMFKKGKAKNEGNDSFAESGERYKKLVAKLKNRGAEDPKALAAWIGRKKLGKKEFQRRAAQGRKKA